MKGVAILRDALVLGAETLSAQAASGSPEAAALEGRRMDLAASMRAVPPLGAWGLDAANPGWRASSLRRNCTRRPVPPSA